MKFESVPIPIDDGDRVEMVRRLPGRDAIEEMLAGTVICLSIQNERRFRVFLEVENGIKKPVRGLKDNIFRLLSWLMSAFYAFFSDILPVVFWYSKESIIKSVTVLAA